MDVMATKNPRRYSSEGFHFGLIVISFPVQPLADIMTDYTRRDRKNKRDECRHDAHLLPYRIGAMTIIKFYHEKALNQTPHHRAEQDSAQCPPLLRKRSKLYNSNIYKTAFFIAGGFLA